MKAFTRSETEINPVITAHGRLLSQDLFLEQAPRLEVITVLGQKRKISNSNLPIIYAMTNIA